MSTEFPVQSGPPWDVDTVADVHAGVYPPEQTAELLQRISADPAGAAILAALDSTVDSLSLLPQLTMPAQYSSRLEAAISAEHATAAGRGTTAAAPTSVLRGGMATLLQPGAVAAPPGLPRPAGMPGPGGHSGGQRPSVPRPRTDPAGTSRPTFPQRRQPVIPPVLPRRPRPEQTTTPVTVTDLQAARDNAASRPEPARPAIARTGPVPSSQRVGSLQAQRSKRRRWTGGLLAAAAVIAVGTVTAVAVTSDKNPGNGQAVGPDTTITHSVLSPGDSQNPSAFVLEKGKYADSINKIVQGKAGGRLADPLVYAACLNANGIPLGDVGGASDVTFEGKSAYAIAVRQADPKKVKIVVVGAGCGTDGAADTLDSQVVDR